MANGIQSYLITTKVASSLSARKTNISHTVNYPREIYVLTVSSTSQVPPKFSIDSYNNTNLDITWENFESGKSCVVNILIISEPNVAASNAIQLNTFGYNVKDYGAKGDGITDDSDALDLAHAAAGVGGRIFLPSGKYRQSRTWHIQSSKTIQGNGGAGYYTGNSILFPDDGVTSIQINTYQTGPHPGSPGGDGEGAYWSNLRDFGIKAAGKTIPGADGIRLYDRAYIQNIVIYRMSRHGICGVGRANGDGAGHVTDVDTTVVMNAYILLCDGDGVFFDGGDANACSISNVNCSGNGLAGFHESGFLGNTYIGCIAESNGQLAAGNYGYNFDEDGAYNTVIGCYSEEDNPNHFGANTTVLGGDQGGGIGGTGALNLIGNTFHNSVSFAVQSTAAAATYGESRLGSNGGAPHSWLDFYISEQSQTLGFRYDSAALVNWKKAMGIMWGNSTALVGQLWTGDLTETTNIPRLIGPGYTAFPRGFFLGEKKIFTATSIPPVAGTWHQGDMVMTSLPTSGNPPATSCVLDGTFGTYTEELTAQCFNTTAVTLSGTSAVLKVGDVIVINGVTGNAARILSINGANLVLSVAQTTGGPGLSVAYRAPTFKAWANLA